MPENARQNVFTLLLLLLLLLLRTNIGSSSIRRQNSGAPGMKIADETLLTLQFDVSITRIGFWEMVPALGNYTKHVDLEKFHVLVTSHMGESAVIG